MSKLAEPWVKLLAELTAAQVDFIVIGGAAAILNSVSIAPRAWTSSTDATPRTSSA